MNSDSPLELVPIQNLVTHEQRARQLKQRGYLIWFTGLSGSGKSTLASQLELRLYEMGFKTYLLDGDGLRSGLNKDLPFTKEGRSENIRRVGEVSKLFIDAGLIVLAAFISPFEEDRKLVKQIVGDDCYTEVFVDAPLEICEARDVKGLYRKARAGKITNFTGIDSPYEAPLHADVKIETHLLSVNQSLSRLIEVVHPRIAIEFS